MPLALLEQRIDALTLSKSELARRAGLSRPTLRLLLKGRGTVRKLETLLPPLGLRWAGDRNDAGSGAWLTERRKAMRLTQAEVAARLGLSRPVIIALEREMLGEVASLLAYSRLLGLASPFVLAKKGRRLVPATNPAAADRVMTPPALARAVCAHFAPQMQGSVLDPACGTGAFLDAFPSDMEKHWCEIDEGRDFFHWHERVDWVFTNPPWSRLADFLSHAMRVTDNIVFVAPYPNLTTKARLRRMHAAGFGLAEIVRLDTPKEWPQSGFQLVAAWIRRGDDGNCRMSELGR